MLQTGFPRGRIIPSSDVIGRRGFLEQLEERLVFGDSTMLAGPRRTGKSSVAFEVLRRLEARGCYVLDLDLLHVSTRDEFALRMIQKVAQLRTGVFHHSLHTVQEFLRWLTKPELFIKVQDIEFGARLPFESNPDPLAILQEALDAAERIAEKDGKRVVILLDEFQEVDRLGGGMLLRYLRSVFQRQQNVTYLFLGSEPSMMRTIFADKRQAFYRFATMLHLPDIDAAEWEEYVRSKLTLLHMSIHPIALDMALRATGGHPYGFMAVLANAFLTARLSGELEITVEFIRAGIEQTFEQLDAIYEELWKRILDIRGGDAVLTDIASGAPPYRGKNATLVRRAVDQLLESGIIVKTGRGQYRFVEPMFRHWILSKVGGQQMLFFV